MSVDPQALGALIASAIVLAGTRLYQIGTKQGRALRRSYRRQEEWEQYGLLLRRELRRHNKPVPPWPESLKYMNPSSDFDGGDHD